MANTKKLSRADRKQAKRKARKRLKKLRASMTRDEKKKFEQALEAKIKPGLKSFLTKLRKEKSESN